MGIGGADEAFAILSLYREVVKVRTHHQRCIPGKVQINTAEEVDRAADKLSRRDEHRASSGSAGCIDGFLDRFSVQRLAIAHGALFRDAEALFRNLRRGD